MPMTRWEFWIVPCLAGGNASVTCLKVLVKRFADVQWPAPLSLLLPFAAQYKFVFIIIIIIIIIIKLLYLIDERQQRFENRHIYGILSLFKLTLLICAFVVGS